MIGELTSSQIEFILTSGMIGRLGCIDEEKLYIVPVTYVYKEGYLYCHSKEGTKINMMRKNPAVCFEVEDINDMMNWRTVIAWGEYEELKTPAWQREAIRLLKDRFDPIVTSSSTRQGSPNANPPLIVEKDLKAILFRIKLNQLTGRFEKPDPH